MNDAYERGLAALPGIRERCAAATKGPLLVYGSCIYAPDRAMIAQVFNPGSNAKNYPLVPNRELFASAPTDLPLLCDALEAAREEIERFKSFLDRNDTRCHCVTCDPTAWPDTNGWRCKTSKQLAAKEAELQAAREEIAAAEQECIRVAQVRDEVIECQRDRIAELEKAIKDDLTYTGHIEGCNTFNGRRPCDCAARVLKQGAAKESHE